MVSRVASLCFAVLLLLAGCAGTQPSAVGTSDSNAETTTTPTPEPTTTTATTTTNRAGTTTSPTHATLDAEELSISDHELLGQAVENGSVQVRPNRSGRLTPDTDGWHARYGGTLYELSWQPAGFRGEYHLESVTKVNSSAVDSAGGGIAYTNLSADARQLFDLARAGNESEGRGAELFPDQFREYAYVKDNGDYYALEIVVGDFIVYRLSVTEVES